MLQMPLQTMHQYEDESTNYVLDSTLLIRKAETEFFSFPVVSAYNGCRNVFASWNKKLTISAAIKQKGLINLACMKRPPFQLAVSYTFTKSSEAAHFSTLFNKCKHTVPLFAEKERFRYFAVRYRSQI